MSTAEATKFIRPDGKDKVTGLGRYTADMTMTGMLHAVCAPRTIVGRPGRVKARSQESEVRSQEGLGGGRDPDAMRW